MSYILDALRKADAQRESDPARGIHAQPMQAAPVASRSHRPAAWMAGGVLLLAGAAAVLFHLRDRGAAPAVPQTPVAATMPAPAGGVAAVPRAAKLPATPQVPVATTPVLSVAATPEPAVAKPVVADAIVPAAPPMPRPAAPPRLPLQRAAPVAVAAPVAAQPLAATPAAVPVQVAAAQPAAPTPAATPAPLKESPAAAAARILAFHELPADVQRELPKLKITGGVHSENAAQRMLIVGGEVTKEGAQLAPGLVLEQIRPKSAVFSFRGYRYSLIY